PVFRGGDFDGCLAAVFRIDTLLDAILAQHPTNGCGIAVHWNGEVIYTKPAPPDTSDMQRSELAAARVPGATWHVRTWPEAELIPARRSLVPHRTLLAGLLVAILVAATLRLAGAARQRAAALEAANAALTGEMEERAKAERRLRAQLAATSVLSS